MKKNLVLFVFLFVQPGFSQSILRIAVGDSYFTSAPQVGRNEMAQNGATLSLFFPLAFPVVDAHLKMGVSRHSRVAYLPRDQIRDWRRWEIDKLYNCTNEILVGKSLRVSDRFSILPQFGFGALGELYVYNGARKGAHVDLFFDASILFNVELGGLSTGVIFNIEKDFGLSDWHSGRVRIRSQAVFGL